MTQIFDNRWVNRNGEIYDRNGAFCDNFLVWCEKTELLTNEQFYSGVASVEMAVTLSAMKSETAWPPTYPEFIGICMSSGFGIPCDAQDALWYLQGFMQNRGVSRDWSKIPSVMYWAYQKLDWYNLQQQKQADQLKIFTRVWDEALKLAANGFKFPPPPAPVDELPCLPASKEFAAEKMNSLKKLFE